MSVASRGVLYAAAWRRPGSLAGRRGSGCGWRGSIACHPARNAAYLACVANK